MELVRTKENQRLHGRGFPAGTGDAFPIPRSLIVRQDGGTGGKSPPLANHLQTIFT